MFRDVVRRFTETLSADKVNTGIAEIKLGRTLLRENHYKEAEAETLAGDQTLIKQTSPSTSYIRAARKDLIADYDALKQPQQAAKFRAELAAAEASNKKQLLRRISRDGRKPSCGIPGHRRRDLPGPDEGLV